MLSAASKKAAGGQTGAKPKYEVAHIFQKYGKSYLQSYRLSPVQFKVMHDILVCRTANLGGHIEKCNRCGIEKNAYNPCRNRHCPKCQTLRKEQWLIDRGRELLPVSYFHNVFTLPHEINPIALVNKKVIFDILFKAVSDTLQTFAHDPKHKLKGQLGFIAVLHTWNQTLLDHIHLHCLIPAGALSSNRKRFNAGPKNFLFPVKALSKVFRGKFIDALKKAYTENKLIFPGRTIEIQSRQGFSDLINQLYKKEWVVYSKKPFAGPKQVLAYLGRYTHRIAISNNRILSINNGSVSFAYKDRSNNDTRKTMSLKANEFIRRFLIHTLPKGYTRIRHFGFLANRNKIQNITTVRTLLNITPNLPKKMKKTFQEMMFHLTGVDVTLCPHCKKGRMVFLKDVIKVKTNTFLFFDSS